MASAKSIWTRRSTWVLAGMALATSAPLVTYGLADDSTKKIIKTSFTAPRAVWRLRRGDRLDRSDFDALEAIIDMPAVTKVTGNAKWITDILRNLNVDADLPNDDKENLVELLKKVWPDRRLVSLEDVEDEILDLKLEAEMDILLNSPIFSDESVLRMLSRSVELLKSDEKYAVVCGALLRNLLITGYRPMWCVDQLKDLFEIATNENVLKSLRRTVAFALQHTENWGGRVDAHAMLDILWDLWKEEKGRKQAFKYLVNYIPVSLWSPEFAYRIVATSLFNDADSSKSHYEWKALTNAVALTVGSEVNCIQNATNENWLTLKNVIETTPFSDWAHVIANLLPFVPEDRRKEFSKIGWHEVLKLIHRDSKSSANIQVAGSASSYGKNVDGVARWCCIASRDSESISEDVIVSSCRWMEVNRLTSTDALWMADALDHWMSHSTGRLVLVNEFLKSCPPTWWTSLYSSAMDSASIAQLDRSLSSIALRLLPKWNRQRNKVNPEQLSSIWKFFQEKVADRWIVSNDGEVRARALQLAALMTEIQLPSFYADGVHVLYESPKGSNNLNVDIVFVHGVGGDYLTTWVGGVQPEAYEDESQGKTHGGSFYLDDDSPLEENEDLNLSQKRVIPESIIWPRDWLGPDVRPARILSVSYPAEVSRWFGDPLPLKTLALILLEWLRLASVGTRPVVFVCHSYGGLLVKQLLALAGSPTSHSSSLRPLALEDVEGVVFISTPHFGVEYIRYMQYPSVRWIMRSSDAADALDPLSPSLKMLNDSFPVDSIATLSIGEGETCFGIPPSYYHVVPNASANPGFKSSKVVHLFKESSINHFDVCKPVSREDPIYRAVLDFIAELSKLE